MSLHISNNVRELEGALNRITAYSNLLDSKIDINAASKIIKDLINEQIKTVDNSTDQTNCFE